MTFTSLVTYSSTSPDKEKESGAFEVFVVLGDFPEYHKEKKIVSAAKSRSARDVRVICTVLTHLTPNPRYSYVALYIGNCQCPGHK